LTSKEARKLLFDKISTDREFYQSLSRQDEGDEDDQEGADNGGDGGTISYDEVDSSETIHEAIENVIRRAPASSLAEIYGDQGDELLGESDTEEGGVGINLDLYTSHAFSTRDATRRWTEWNSK
jgi:hypothetical protein